MARTAKKGERHLSKSAFIRKHPDLSPQEVAEKAAEAGLSVDASAVSAIRSQDRRRAKASDQPNLSKKEYALRNFDFTRPVAELIQQAANDGVDFNSSYLYRLRQEVTASQPETALDEKEAKLTVVKFEPKSAKKVHPPPTLEGMDSEMWDQLMRWGLKTGLRRLGRELLAVAETV